MGNTFGIQETITKMQTANMPKEEENYLKMHLLLTVVVPKAVRYVFDRELHPPMLMQAIRGRLWELNRNRIFSTDELKLLVSTDCNSASFDVQLMMKLLKILAQMDISNRCPIEWDMSLQADLTRINYYIKQVAYFENGQINSATFTTIWWDICGAITRLTDNNADVVAECERLRKKRFYHSTENSYIGVEQNMKINVQINDVQDSKARQEKIESSKNAFSMADLIPKDAVEDEFRTAHVEQNMKINVPINDVQDSKARQEKIESSKNAFSMADIIPKDAVEDEIRTAHGSNIPEQIRKMDTESIGIYLNALESGSEQRRDINLVIVGKKGVGKTSIVRRLFGEELNSVKSTNGVEVHRRRCRINLSNWEWNKMPDTPTEKDNNINKRILQSMVKEMQQAQRINTMPKTSLFDLLESDENIKKNEISTTEKKEIDNLKKIIFSSTDQATVSKRMKELEYSQLALQELSSIIRSGLCFQDEDSYATLTVWDFAGDKEYYDTHQIFLNPEAIYLVVASLDDIDVTDSHGTFNFWMESIHCYGSKPDMSCGDEGLLDPPVIAIGTHTDKFQNKEECRLLLASYTDGIFKDTKLHLRSIQLISNTNDEETVFRELRNDIFAIASNNSNWNRKVPVKFIQIEKAINSELMKGKRIISFERVKELGSNISMPITDDQELRIFLRYQHEIGNLIFFENIPLYIILDPQWLANAFKCIVAAQQFQFELPHLQWHEYKQTGKMDQTLLDAIFQKQSADIRKHKEHILKVLEKFDIIVYPSLLTNNGSLKQDPCFFVPCMIQTSQIEDIDKVFKVPDGGKSTCLCFVFRFLPPLLTSNLFVSCLREYPLAAIRDHIGLFKDSCVFNISENGCSKFLLAKCNHTIELQVWQWGKTNSVQNQNVLKFVEGEINRIVKNRYKLKTVSFEKKWKCETSSYMFDKGFHDFDEVQEGEDYLCTEHGTVHKYKDHWSGEETKVPEELTNEQRNFTRLSMVVLDILRSVLYDRLNIDKNAGQLLSPCDYYDTTSLYQEHRKLNRHIPSKGRWGGGRKVDDISPNDTSIGDDIERIRLIRNEMQHSTIFALDDTRYLILITVLHDMLTRFDQRNNPIGDSYVNRLDEVSKIELKTRNLEEIKERVKTELRERLHEVVDSLLSNALQDIC